MKAAPQDTFLLDPSGQCVHLGHARHRAVERRVETGNLGNVREAATYRFDGVDCLRQMIGIDRNERSKGCNYLPGHESWLGVLRAAMHHAMPDATEGSAHIALIEVLQHSDQRFAMVVYGASLIEDHSAGRIDDVKPAVGTSDPLDFCRQLDACCLAAVVEPRLQAGGACINGKDDLAPQFVFHRAIQVCSLFRRAAA